MNDLVTWLRVQLDEDERVAGAAVDGPWRVNDDSGEVETVRLYGTPGYERPLQVTQDSEGILPSVNESDAPHIARFNPARALVEVEAKRHLVEQAELRGRAVRTATLDGGFFDHILRLLALPYVDEPGYREEWRP